VCKRLRQDPRTRAIPIIHISATYVTTRDEVSSLESGADFYLAEPVGSNELAAAVRTLVRLRAMEQGYAASQERMRLATEGAGIATWDIDVDSGAAVWSRQFFELLGYKEGKMPRTRDAWLACIRPEDREAVAADLERAAVDGAAFSREHWIVRADNGEPRCLAAYGKLHVGDGTMPPRLIGVAMDITERRRAEIERETVLQQARAAQKIAEEATRTKDEFLATLSHELRTPMSAMLGWLQLIRTGKLDPERYARALDTIERNARLQTQLVDDLLDVSRIVTGKLQIESAPVRVQEALQNAIESLRPAAEARGITLARAIDAGIGPVLGSLDRLQQVFSNLLANAIKFTPQGGRVEVTLDGVGAGVRIRFSDTGEGIEPDLLPHVFDRFRQADSSTRRAYSGLGLGLAIVRSLVELHGGTVAAESPGRGRGASFTILLPLAPEGSLSQMQPQSVAADGGFGLNNLRVLIVDDNKDAAWLTASILKLEGAAVETAESARQALESARSLRPEVLILDIGLPGEDGYELLQRLRMELALDATALPAIALTGYASTEDKLRAFKSGFQAHLAKPFDMPDLYRAIRKVAPPR
jgi:PAS domain S-box-containing protein